MIDSVIDIYSDTLKYLNVDVFNNQIYNDEYSLIHLYYFMILMILFMIFIIFAIFVNYVICYEQKYGLKFDLYGNEILDFDKDDIVKDDIVKDDIVKDDIVKDDIVKDDKDDDKSKVNPRLYTESIIEVSKMNDLIIDKMLDSNLEKSMYWVLLRVQMKTPLTMYKSKYELHGNHTGDSKANIFTTKDAFMIIKFIYHKGKDSNINKSKVNKNISGILVNFMNYYNNVVEENYKTSDFIVVAISQITEQTNTKEFYSGLISNEYEMDNYHDVIFTVPKTNVRAGYILTLPIHKIYDIFLDVFPNVIFESKDYEMDNNNYESWKGMSMNELTF